MAPCLRFRESIMSFGAEMVPCHGFLYSRHNSARFSSPGCKWHSSEESENKTHIVIHELSLTKTYRLLSLQSVCQILLLNVTLHRYVHVCLNILSVLTPYPELTKSDAQISDRLRKGDLATFSLFSL